jgi:hypothetical protein
MGPSVRRMFYMRNRVISSELKLSSSIAKKGHQVSKSSLNSKHMSGHAPQKTNDLNTSMFVPDGKKGDTT